MLRGAGGEVNGLTVDVRQRFTVMANKTTPIRVELHRCADMAAKWWYSGEDRIHYALESEYDDRNLQILELERFVQDAEGVLAHFLTGERFGGKIGFFGECAAPVSTISNRHCG